MYKNHIIRKQSPCCNGYSEMILYQCTSNELNPRTSSHIFTGYNIIYNIHFV